jgi:hypothetical protein
MVALKVLKIGDAVGIILPDDVVDGLHFAAGDTVYLTAVAHSFCLTRQDPAFEF